MNDVSGLSIRAERQLMALANPTRRAVYDIVRAQPSSVGAVTAELPVSQPAVSQHLRVLVEAGLVSATPVGAKRVYTADRTGIADLRAWIDGLWDDVLDGFVDAAEAVSPSSERHERDQEPNEEARS